MRAPGSRRATAGVLWRVAAVSAFLAWPNSGEASGDGCAPAGGDTVTVQAVQPDGGIRLTDGRELRLAGLEPAQDTPAHPTLAGESAAKVSAWLAGQPARFQATEALPDRWGRVTGLLFAPGGPDRSGAPLSVATAMVDAGLGRARAEAGAHACWPDLLAAEAAARAAGLGLWGDPYYAVRPAAEAGWAVDTLGGMVLVEGRITHVGHTRTAVFLDFGPPRSGVSLRVSRRASFILGQPGAAQDARVGQAVRARGVVDDPDRPVIVIDDPDQIEWIAAPGLK